MILDESAGLCFRIGVDNGVCRGVDGEVRCKIWIMYEGLCQCRFRCCKRCWCWGW